MIARSLIARSPSTTFVSALLSAALLSTALLAVPAPVTAEPAESGPPAPSGRPTWKVAIVVHEGVELLDFAGPGEVFQVASTRGTTDGHRWFDVFTVAPKDAAVLSQGFLTIVPRYSIETCPTPDILVIPGGATRHLLADPDFMAWVERVAPQTELDLTVCTGAFVAAKAGLLDAEEGGEPKQATTHWSALDQLRTAAPGATILSNVRFVDAGDVVTTAGVSAGIDGSLHVVARLLGRAVAEETARFMEYSWSADPAYPYSRLNPQLDATGQERQEAAWHGTSQNHRAAARSWRKLADRRPDDPEVWYELGLALHSAGQVDEAIEAHRRAAELAADPSKALYNLACALALKGDKSSSLRALAEAVEAGFSALDWMKEDPDLESVRGDRRFARLVRKLENAAGNLEPIDG